jgi:integrase
MLKDELTDTKIKAAIRAAAGATKPTKLADGKGLHLLMKPNGSALWRFKYSMPRYANGNLISLGAYPEVPLKLARERRDEARRQVANNVDPSQVRKAAKAEAVNTFQLLAEEFVDKRMLHATPPLAPRTIQKARTQLREFIYPRFGRRAIKEITLKDVRDALQAITVEGKRIETAYKTKELLGRIYRYAINQYDESIRNIPADLETKEILGKRPEEHLAAILERPKVGELLRAIEGYEGQAATCAALRLLPHVFLRSTELRAAQWPEVNFETAQWRIPKSRMKPVKGVRQEHFVPLSRQALAILKDLHKITGEGEYLFPAIGPKRRPISENTLGTALRAMGYDSETQTPHGFRAIFRTIAAEDLEIRIDWLELQLAHEVKDANGSAYNRASFLPQRAKVMQSWSDHLDTLRDGSGNVVLFKKRA